MPAQFRTGIPMTSNPLRARSLVNATVRSVVSPSTGGGGSSLLDFFFGLIGFLLLLLQLRCNDSGIVRCGRAVRILAAARRRARWNAFLALIVRQSLQTVVELLAEVIVHFLKVGDLDSWRRIHAAVRLLAAQYNDSNSVIAVGSIVHAPENVAGAQRARLAIRSDIEAGRHDKNAKVGIQRGGDLFRISGGLCRGRSWCPAPGGVLGRGGLFGG